MDDPYYVRDTISQLRTKPEEGAWAGRLAKLRLLKAEIEEHSGGAKPALLQAIEVAFDRIRRGVYHLCAKCGRRIFEDRVRIEGPWIVTCTDCREHGHS